jgi:hypothetical protein
MTQYDYKVVPAPRRAKKIRGIRSTEELFAHTLTEAINEVARQGWEYVRAEHLPAEGPGGWFRGAQSGEQTVRVFRRARETLGPRIAATHEPPGVEDVPAAPVLPPVLPPERPERPARGGRVVAPPRTAHPARRVEPLAASEAPEDFPTPLRPPPRLGPADKG